MVRSLDIDPQADSRYGTTWDLAPQFQNELGSAPDYNIDYVLAHYHEWGSYFRLSFVDDAGRLRVECGYINDTDRRLTYGLAGKEMCVFLAYSDADLKIGATSGENTAMGPNEDGVFVSETACGPLVAVRAD